MKLTYGNQTIDFLNFEPKPKVAVLSLSGGLDSASLFYITCKYAPDIEIVPVTCRDQNAPLDALAAIHIVEWMRNEFPHVTIHHHEVHDFNDRTEDFVSFAQADFARMSADRYKGLNRTQMSKILQVDKINYSVLAKWPEAPHSIRFDGMTSNPSLEEMQKYDAVFAQKAESRRSHDGNKIEKSNVLYQPFINVDKKFVAGIYQDEGLMDSLFHYCRSCVGTAKETNNFMQDCHKCFWCYEKKWAFDLQWD
jgi:hypothetical protein